METVFPDQPPIEDPSKIVIQGISWQNAFFSTTKQESAMRLFSIILTYQNTNTNFLQQNMIRPHIEDSK